MLHRIEMNLIKSIILAVRKSDYAGLFEKVWGPGFLDADKDVDGTYVRIGRAIAAYERSAEENAIVEFMKTLSDRH
jgi:cytochrome c peroxidase